MLWKIFPLVPSEMVIDLGRMTYLRNYGKALWLPCPFFIVKGGKETFMVDTSGSAKVMSKLRVEPVRDVMSLDEALERVDLKPQDISLVVLTHLMYDHCANAKLLPNARFVVQKKELEYAESPHPLFAGAYQSQLFEGLNFEVIEGDHQLMPGIDIIHSPGHSPGCQSVAVKTSAGTAVITGFCCVMDNFEPESGSAWVSELLPEVIPPGIHLDMQEAYASAKKIKDIADIIIPIHDPLLKTKPQIPD